MSTRPSQLLRSGSQQEPSLRPDWGTRPLTDAICPYKPGTLITTARTSTSSATRTGSPTFKPRQQATSYPSRDDDRPASTPVNCYGLPGQLLRIARSTVTISPVNCYVLALIPTQNRLYRLPTPTSTEEGEGCGGRAPLIPRPHTPSIRSTAV